MTCAKVRGTFPAGRRARAEDADEIAIERACRGERLPLNVTERELAVARCLRVLRLSHRETAQRLGVGDRTVQRIKNRLEERESAVTVGDSYNGTSPVRAIIGGTTKDSPRIPLATVSEGLTPSPTQRIWG